ncbi:MAG TPA: CHAP domain-containing protein [Pirellulales bacterium]|nr:CHAP domain-containing protein [Pirellulales bacterium]
MFRSRASVAFLVTLAVSGSSKADFVELERMVEQPGADLAEKLGGTAVVVAVRNGAAGRSTWNVPQAFGLELAAALRRHHIDAVRAAADSRFEKLETADRPFNANHAKALKDTDRQAIVGVEWLAGKKPRIKIVAVGRQSAKPLWTSVVEPSDKALSLENNIPPENRAVVEFARKALGRPVREGDCTHLAEEALKAAGTGKRGIYHWGRELGPREAWLPGDLLQMERVTVTLPGGTRGFGHHTAVVEEVRNDAVVVLHQNAFPDGKVVQRETWPLAGIDGYIAAYRPWGWPQENVMPPACPTRATPAQAASEKKAGSSQPVNLLGLIDPRRDRVQGIWFFEKEGVLRSPCEFEARLQVAVEPPKSYSLEMTVERLQGSECFGLGITVGGRQTMLAIDGYNSRFTGLHNLDGKPANDNESTKTGTFLPLKKRVQLECRVKEDQIDLDIDKEPILHWQGDANRLSLSPDWPVPHSEWLFLSAFNSEFEISAFMLKTAHARFNTEQ